MSSGFEHSRQMQAPSLLGMANALHDEAPQVEVAPESAPPPPAEPKRIVQTVSGLTLAGAVLGATLAFAWPSSYVATAEMMVAPTTLQSASLSFAPPSDTSLAVIENQLRALRSGSMLTAAVERLNLASDAEFNGNEAGPFAIGGAIMNFGDLVAGDGANVVEQRRRRAIETLAGAVDAHRVGGSSVIAITARTSDPAKSALIANTISDLFLAQLGGNGASTAKTEELRAGLAEAETDVAAFRREHGLLAASEIEQLENELDMARTRAAEFGTLLASVRQTGVDVITTGSIQPQGGTAAMGESRVRIASLKQRVDSLATRLGPRHPELLTAQAELESARREADKEARRVSTSLEAELGTVTREEQHLANRLADVKNRQAAAGDRLNTLKTLEQTVVTRRAAYDEAQRATRMNDRAGTSAGARVISHAEPPLQAAGFGAPTLSLAGALGGLFAGLGLTGWRRTAREETAVDEDQWNAASEHEFDETEWGEEQEHWADAAYQPEETEAMYPYPPHAPSPAPVQGIGQQEQHPAPAHPGHAYPYPPQQVAAGWYPPQPHDPWAQARAYPPMPYAPPAPPYAPAAYPHQQPAVVYIPVQTMPSDAFAQRGGAYERDVLVDRRTDAAIEEIRQSLRALREAIEDFADDRYGT